VDAHLRDDGRWGCGMVLCNTPDSHRFYW
jgi:hypothetical protein